MVLPTRKAMLNSVKSPKDEIVIAASRQFEETGDVSMRKVGDAVGVTATALYYHFKNKQDLLDAIADRGFANFEARLRSVDTRDRGGIIRGVLLRYTQFAQDHPNLFRLMFVEPRPVARKFPADFAAHRSPVFNLLWRAVAEWMAGTEEPEGFEGQERAPTPESDESLHVAHDVWALAHGLIVLSQAGRF